MKDHLELRYIVSHLCDLYQNQKIYITLNHLKVQKTIGRILF